MEFNAWENIVFGYHTDAAYQNGLFMDNAGIKAEALAKMKRFDIRPPDPRLRARSFSGGNQQKIVLAREMSAIRTFFSSGNQPAVLILALLNSFTNK